MPRYEDSNGTRLYVGHLSSRTRSQDLEHIFSRYGRVRDVDMKKDYAFVDFSDSRDADDARYKLDGKDVDGRRITVEFARGVPRGHGGARETGGRIGGREIGGRGPVPGSGRCFNCGIEGHWARDCKDGDWKNKCYRCGERGHVERDCKDSPKKLRRGRSYSRSPVRSRSPRRGRSRSRSFSPRRSYSRSRSPAARRGRDNERRSRERSSKMKRHARDRSLTPDNDTASEKANSDHNNNNNSKETSRSPSVVKGKDENGKGNPGSSDCVADENDVGSPAGSESPRRGVDDHDMGQLNSSESP